MEFAGPHVSHVTLDLPADQLYPLLTRLAAADDLLVDDVRTASGPDGSAIVHVALVHNPRPATWAATEGCHVPPPEPHWDGEDWGVVVDAGVDPPALSCAEAAPLEEEWR